MQESGEMYLETILRIGKKKPTVRAIDIVDEMRFSKPSVSRALSKLKKGDCVEVDEKGFITLTQKGRAIAEKIYERHRVLTEFFVALGVDEEIAAQDACKVEHVISDTTFEAIKCHAHRESDRP
ncbi:MAG: metal-dependent transcriptional regulator [Christensenellales bacterium]|jgi:Mn-dependent DtxR family transcriptional regulator